LVEALHYKPEGRRFWRVLGRSQPLSSTRDSLVSARFSVLSPSKLYVGTVSEIRPRDLSTYIHRLPYDEVTDHFIRYSVLDCQMLQVSIACVNKVEKGKKENEERGR